MEKFPLLWPKKVPSVNVAAPITRRVNLCLFGPDRRPKSLRRLFPPWWLSPVGNGSKAFKVGRIISGISLHRPFRPFGVMNRPSQSASGLDEKGKYVFSNSFPVIDKVAANVDWSRAWRRLLNASEAIGRRRAGIGLVIRIICASSKVSGNLLTSRPIAPSKNSFWALSNSLMFSRALLTK